MGHQIDLALGAYHGAEASASLLALMAFPYAHEVSKREAARLKLHGRMVLERARAGKLAASEVSTTDEAAIDFLMKERSGLVQCIIRLRARFAAGNIALADLYRSLGYGVGWPAGLEEPDFTTLVSWAAEIESGTEENVRNFEKRKLAPSEPVMSLAVALCAVIQERARAGVPMVDLSAEGADPKFVEAWVNLANVHAPQIEARWPNRRGMRTQPRFNLVPASPQKVTGYG